MEAKGIRTDKGEFNRWIKATNSVIREIKKKIAELLDWLKEVKEELAKPQTSDCSRYSNPISISAIPELIPSGQRRTI